MSAMTSQITSLAIAYPTVYSGTDERKYQSSTVTGEVPTQRSSNAENVSIWWRHHVPLFPVVWFPGDGKFALQTRAAIAPILQTTFSD